MHRKSSVPCSEMGEFFRSSPGRKARGFSCMMDALNPAIVKQTGPYGFDIFDLFRSGSESPLMKVSKDMICPSCNVVPIRRVSREGFWQKYICSMFGYYPWKCPRCGSLSMLRKRGRRSHKKHKTEGGSRSRKETVGFQDGA